MMNYTRAITQSKADINGGDCSRQPSPATKPAVWWLLSDPHSSDDPPPLLSFHCPLAVHPVQAISLPQGNMATVIAEAKLNKNGPNQRNVLQIQPPHILHPRHLLSTCSTSTATPLTAYIGSRWASST